MHQTMKKFQVLLSVLLVLGLLLSPAPGNAVAETAVTDRAAAVTLAGDRLTANQNTDGGFGWKLPTDGTSYHNVLGITAMGILKAYEFDPKPAYEAGLANALAYTVNTPPQYLWSDTASRYIENTKGVDSSPDFNFLIWLAQAAASDPSLLTAINDLQEPDITAPDIAALAKTRWDEKVVLWGSDQQDPPNGTAVKMAERLRDDRHNQSLDAVGIWDIELAISAAYALDSYFPGAGYAQQALDMVDVIYAAIDDGIYFDSMDTGQSDYVVGLTGAIKAFVETGQHLDKATSLNAILQSLQQVDGSWNYYASTPATKSVQSTAYAIMALNSMGDPESVLAANQAADWLVKNQKIGGGWYAENGTGDEILEVDSEAAWALATLPPPVTIGSLGYYSIQSAIVSANAGDTINVAAGIYVTTGQVVIDKYLTIVGADKTTTIIKPGSNTGGADNDTRGWFLINPDVVFNLSNVTLDGAGKLIHTAIRSWGNGVIEDNIIRNIRYSDYLGIGIYFFDTVTVRNNTLSNIERIGIYANGTYESTDSIIEGNAYTGKGAGEWLDYGVEVERGAHVIIRNNTITNCKGVAYDGSTSAGIYATTYFANPSSTTTALIENNMLADNLYGISAGYLPDDTALVIAHFNQFLGNTYGISAKGVPVDGETNWWGSITGPTADHFVGTVDFNPWCGDAACTFLMPPVVVDQAVTTGYQTPVTITLTAPNVGENILAWTILDPPANGVLSGAAPTLTYTPDPGYSGIDSFTFKGSIEGVESNVGTVAITVSEPFIYYFPIISNN